MFGPRQRRTDIKSITVIFDNGDELTTDDVKGYVACEVNDNGFKNYNPNKSWRDWTIRWSERDSTPKE